MHFSIKSVLIIFFVILLLVPFNTACSKAKKDDSSDYSSDMILSSEFLSPTDKSEENGENAQNNENGTDNGSQSDNSDSKKSVVKGIFLSDKPLEGFERTKLNYTVVLADNASALPKVTVLQSNGTGKVKIVQAKSIGDTATVTLNGTTYSITFIKKDKSAMFKNTYYKLNTKKKLNIAYFGGSITAGFGATDAERYSYRAIVTNWFKKQFPSANIKETNAAIGGTGTAYGIYRAVTDLKLESATEKPDLVFLEFAINDIYDGTKTATAKSNLEYIIRTVYKYSSDADIFLVLTTDQACMNNDYDMLVAHRSIAEAYNIPYICVGKMLWDEMLAENKGQYPTASIYNKYFHDTVHPANGGYAKYAGYITSFFADAFASKGSAQVSPQNSYMPSNPLNPLPSSPYISNLKGQSAPTGISVDGDGHITSNSNGATLKFTFCGTDLSVWQWGTAHSGVLSVNIDGNALANVDLFCESENHNIRTLASGLNNQTHTVTLTLNASAHGSSMDIWYFLISGSDNQSEIRLVN